MGNNLKETEIPMCKEVITYKEQSPNDGKEEIQKLCQEGVKLIKNEMCLFENFFVPGVCPKETTIIWQNMF